VTEAACKTLVKQRLCASGMRWKHKGAKIILSVVPLGNSRFTGSFGTRYLTGGLYSLVT
jgi:hypothetical protein